MLLLFSGPFCYVDSCHRRRALSRFCIEHLDSSCNCQLEESSQLKIVKLELDHLREYLLSSNNDFFATF